jgi:hypothetical protein
MGILQADVSSICVEKGIIIISGSDTHQRTWCGEWGSNSPMVEVSPDTFPFFILIIIARYLFEAGVTKLINLSIKVGES